MGFNLGSVVSGVLKAVTGGGSSGGASELSGADALAKFKGKDGKALESWSKSNGEELMKYVSALGKNTPKELSGALSSSALDFIVGNAQSFFPEPLSQADKDAKKNLALASIRKNIFKQLLQDGFDQMAKIKPLQW